MKRFWVQADWVLRGGPLTDRGILGLWPLLLGTILLGSFVYGAVMGGFGGISGDRVVQLLFSGIKVPLLLLVSFVIALPSFFVLNTLFGVRADFPEVLRALLVSQAGLAIVLVALAPYTILWYASSADYQAAILFNGVMFAVASLAAQGILRRSYAPLLARRHRHRWLMWSWLVLYVFVGIQMAWVLRPFVGAPDLPPQFLREESWGNAYIVVFQMIWKTLADR